MSGNVAAGSIFAGLQSVGTGAAGLGLVAKIGGVVGGLGGAWWGRAGQGGVEETKQSKSML